MSGRRFLGLGFLAILIFVSCSKREQTAPLASGIIVTNIVHTNETFFNPTGAVETVVLLTNGTYFGYHARPNMVSVDLPGHYGAWIYYDTNNKPRKMIHQFYGANNYWLHDYDADGIPDIRVDYNEGPNRGSKSIFMKGEWVDAKVLGTNATAIIDEKRAQVQFSNGKWAVIGSEKPQ